jgi:transcriptional regulator with XRE-family HTH domain
MPAYYLRRLRRERGLTLEAVAYLSGIDEATLSRIERGRQRPKPETIVAIARALGTRPRQLAARLAEPAEPAPEPAWDAL